MDDPYQKVLIEHGALELQFTIFYNLGSWDVTNAVYKFRYQQGQLCLIGADESSFNRATHDVDDYSYNFLTRQRTLTEGHDDMGVQKKTIKSVKNAVLKTLKTFNRPFRREVEEGIYL